jgi:hypothetical protein
MSENVENTAALLVKQACATGCGAGFHLLFDVWPNLE